MSYDVWGDGDDGSETIIDGLIENGWLDGNDLSQAMHDIIGERSRQEAKEGEDWTYEHDDQHTGGSLAAVAACYANPIKIIIDGCGPRLEGLYDCDMPIGWPASWDYQWWKPGGERRNLVKAGALIVAEIERLDRVAEKAAKEVTEQQP